jgi:hypothetical protein
MCRSAGTVVMCSGSRCRGRENVVTEAGFWMVRPRDTERDTWVGMADVSDHSDLDLAEELASGSARTDPIPLVVVKSGRYVGDMLHASGEFIQVVSAGLVAVLEEVDATGWIAVPAEIRDGNGRTRSDYRVLVTTGRCADFRIAREDGDFNEQPVDVSVGWDGSDVFWFEAPSMGFLVTDRVKRAMEAAGLQRLVFEVPRS